MMETVEDILKKAILTGLPWDWESYGGYLDSIERSGPQINVGGLAGHCAIRFYVMGERSVEEPATPDEIVRIAKLAGDSVREGALGFSTNRHLGHLLPDGRCIPGTHAEHEEVRAIAAEVGRAGGIMQTVMNFQDMEKEMDLIGEGAALSRGALFSAVAGPTTELGTRLVDFCPVALASRCWIVFAGRSGSSNRRTSSCIPGTSRSWNAREREESRY